MQNSICHCAFELEDFEKIDRKGLEARQKCFLSTKKINSFFEKKHIRQFSMRAVLSFSVIQHSQLKYQSSKLIKLKLVDLCGVE